MSEYQLGNIEAKFADIIWNNEPLQISELVKRAESEFGWKRTTTYTVLKRLNEKGIFQNVNGTVTSLISREEFYSLRCENFVNEYFDGSLPVLVAAFTKKNKLSAEEVRQIRNLIDNYEE